MTVIEAIGVDAPEPVRIRLEIEREGVEAPRGAEPNKLVRAPVELGPEGVGMLLPERAVGAVGREHEIRA